MNATVTGVKCGNHPQPTYHDSVAQVRACFAESAWKRHRPSAAEARVEAATNDWLNDDAKFDAMIQERERAEDERVTRAKLDRDVPDTCSMAKPVTEDGVYRNPQTGQIFKVYHTVHGRNVQVAKELVVFEESDWYTKRVRNKDVTVKAEFVYRGIAPLRVLTASMQMTLAEAKAYGALYGVCVRCGLTLTKEVSIERAMGDVCAGKANWA